MMLVITWSMESWVKKNMPIYEFFCNRCNRVFSFLSKRVDTTSRPDCPDCGVANLPRYPSHFSLGKSEKVGASQSGAVEEEKLTGAFTEMMAEVATMENPSSVKMVRLMQDLADNAGAGLAGPMREAMIRIENGEEPGQVEQEMGEFLQGYEEDIEGQDNNGAAAKPSRDDRLYDLQ